jgi:hypothetical protein
MSCGFAFAGFWPFNDSLDHSLHEDIVSRGEKDNTTTVLTSDDKSSDATTALIPDDKSFETASSVRDIDHI